MAWVEERLREAGYPVPEPPRPVAAYVPWTKSGRWVFTSGQLPFRDGRLVAVGRVGEEVSPEDALRAAEMAVVNALAVVRSAIGDLDRVVQVVRLTGYVASAPGFRGQASVVNGASELLLKAFGEKGRHVRTAVGVAELPLGAPVEVELMVEVEEDHRTG